MPWRQLRPLCRHKTFRLIAPLDAGVLFVIDQLCWRPDVADLFGRERSDLLIGIATKRTAPDKTSPKLSS